MVSGLYTKLQQQQYWMLNIKSECKKMPKKDLFNIFYTEREIGGDCMSKSKVNHEPECSVLMLQNHFLKN